MAEEAETKKPAAPAAEEKKPATPPAEAAAAGGSAAAPITVDKSFAIESEIYVLQAFDAIAREIAARVRTRAGGREPAVVLIDAADRAALEAYRDFRDTVAVLEGALEKLRADLEAAAESDKRADAILKGTMIAGPVGAAIGLAGKIPDVVKKIESVSKALLPVETYRQTSTPPSTDAFRAILADVLRVAGFKVVSTRSTLLTYRRGAQASAGGGGDAVGQLLPVFELYEACGDLLGGLPEPKAKEFKPRIEGVGTLLATLTDKLLGQSAEGLASRSALRLGAELDTALGGDAVTLETVVVRAAGVQRIAREGAVSEVLEWVRLAKEDDFEQGGAAIVVFHLAEQDGTLLDSDTLVHHTGYQTFPRSGLTWPAARASR